MIVIYSSHIVQGVPMVLPSFAFAGLRRSRNNFSKRSVEIVMFSAALSRCILESLVWLASKPLGPLWSPDTDGDMMAIETRSLAFALNTWWSIACVLLCLLFGQIGSRAKFCLSSVTMSWSPDVRKSGKCNMGSTEILPDLVLKIKENMIINRKDKTHN